MVLLEGLYFAPSLTASVLPAAYRDAAGHDHPVLAIQGTIAAAAASWLRQTLDDAHLGSGDAIALSSPGGNLSMALVTTASAGRSGATP